MTTVDAGSPEETVDRTFLSWQRTIAHSALLVIFATVVCIRVGEPAVAIASSVIALIAIGVGVTLPRPRTTQRRGSWPLMLRAAAVLGLAAGLGVVLPLTVLMTS